MLSAHLMKNNRSVQMGLTTDPKNVFNFIKLTYYSFEKTFILFCLKCIQGIMKKIQTNFYSTIFFMRLQELPENLLS